MRVKNRTITPGLYLLTGVCGVVDATCFLGLGNVFADIMTGNIMFLAFRIGQGQADSSIALYLLPLISFSVGAVSCGYLLWNRRFIGRRRHGFVAVAVLVGVAAVLALMWRPDSFTTYSMVIVGILAFAMGMQNAMVIYHLVPDVATNVMTLTLVRLLSNWSIVGGTNARWHFRMGALLIFFASAAAGAFLLRFGPEAGLLTAFVMYLVALPFLVLAKSPADPAPEGPVSVT